MRVASLFMILWSYIEVVLVKCNIKLIFASEMAMMSILCLFTLLRCLRQEIDIIR